MDPQQELFSEFLVSLKEKYKDTDTGVYDTFLPPEGTPYPFVYLADSRQNDQNTKSEVIGRVSQTFHVWHDNPRQRGTVSSILGEIKAMCRILEHTENYAWQIRDVSQQILPDTTTKQPLLHGVLEVEFQFS